MCMIYSKLDRKQILTRKSCYIQSLRADIVHSNPNCRVSGYLSVFDFSFILFLSVWIASVISQAQQGKKSKQIIEKQTKTIRIDDPN